MFPVFTEVLAVEVNNLNWNKGQQQTAKLKQQV